MSILTRKQREAMARVYGRTSIWSKNREMTTSRPGANKPLTYREFRKRAQAVRNGLVMVPWCGIWLGIETDGHVHS